MNQSYDLLARDSLLNVLQRFPDSWEYNLAEELELSTISPRQRWFLYNACIKFRNYIGNRNLLDYCWNHIMDERNPPISRRAAGVVLNKIKKQAKKEEPKLPRKKPVRKVTFDGYMDISDWQEVNGMWADDFVEEVKKREVPMNGKRYLVAGLKEVAQDFITGKLPYFNR